MNIQCSQLLARCGRPPSIIERRYASLQRIYGSNHWGGVRAISGVPHKLIILQLDQRSRLSKIWTPTGGIASDANEDAHSKLVRAGFLRQAHSGIFHMLPLGLRVQTKVEKLLDKHMSSIGASKLDLSSISSEELWSMSGRLNAINAELFRFKDRKEAGYLLAPTHEEEITSLVANTIKSYKELPVRLYQISRKYRDELRPRHGLLRSREFSMKDLYTFDLSPSLAMVTYNQVRAAYVSLFDELKIRYLVAEADSGDIGGDLSHEYHFPTSMGEDHIISCRSCHYVANEELAESALPPVTHDSGATWSFVSNPEATSAKNTFTVWRGVSRDRSTLINVWYSPREGFQGGSEVNTHAVKSIVADLDPGVENAALLWAQAIEKNILEGQEVSSRGSKIINLVDYRLPPSLTTTIQSGEIDPLWTNSPLPSSLGITISTTAENTSDGQPLNLLRISEGDACPRCNGGSLKIEKAIELGHAFYLGARYSDPMKAVVTLPAGYIEPEAPATEGSAQAPVPLKSAQQVQMQMGCYGIGVSRLIGAVAETLADWKGLNWPRVIAPYEAVVIPARGQEEAAVDVYDALAGSRSTSGDALDVVLDDRTNSFPWKMQDADLAGYPIIVVVGRGWKNSKTCEVQCRRLGTKGEVHLDGLAAYIDKLLARL
ncbi:prolyl-tRNA synthetase [Pseudogymnoascus sp. 05NY08]|nr:prolyl-tRNA synthetase [Pseudogymnoascus sp. 05NY08]